MLDAAGTLAFEAAPSVAEAGPTILPLEARGLVFESDGHRLIDGIDLTLAHGPRTVIMGPNGAGKSLLLRLLHGLLRPSAGSIRWAGHAADRDVKRRQAMVFQRPVLLRRSVTANIDFALRAHRVPAAERRSRIRRMLEVAGLEPLARRPARVLSGGEQQRLAMARALSLEPDVLFLDEPTASLDPASVLAIERLIERAHGDGTKVVLVTHDIGQARRLADEVVFIHRGRIEDKAPAARFFERPASEAARAFLDGRIVL